MSNLRVALLTNSLSPHTLPLCEGIRSHVGEFRAFVSAATDTFHGFPAPVASFPIVVQRSLNRFSLRHRSHAVDVSEPLHLPLDTLQQLLTYRPHVVLTCQFGARTLFAILYRILRPQTRLILWAALSTHTESGRSRFRASLRRWMMRHADAAFVNGRSGADYLRSLDYEGPISTIPYTIDDTLFRRTDYLPADDERRLLFCGRRDATKGILRFCQQLRRWCLAHPERKVSLEMVGDGPDSASIQALNTLPNLKLSVLPRLTQTELAKRYHAADLFVFPTLFDEWGVVTNEAMSAGLPILGSIYSQSVVELVEDGENGWLFQPDDEENTYANLDRALQVGSAQLQQMSLAARKAVDRISPPRVTQRAVRTIADVCGLAPPSPGVLASEAAVLAL